MVGSSGCSPRSAPGRPTLVSPVRMGDWPVMNAARPAVQLCWPYQSVKLHPSLAMRSMFGVRYPMIPLLFMLTLNHPMSSPQMMRMLGLSVLAMRPPVLTLQVSRWSASLDVVDSQSGTSPISERLRTCKRHALIRMVARAGDHRCRLFRRAAMRNTPLALLDSD